MEAFDCLPLAALMNNQFLCACTAGSARRFTPWTIFERLTVFASRPPLARCATCSGSDPLEDFGQEKTGEHYCHNSVRGCSYFYSFPACCDFLATNNLLSVSHQGARGAGRWLCFEGRTAVKFQQSVSVFEARQILLPNFMDVFHSWSLPFVGLRRQ
uniref:Secreted protein n=1 Tax=Macrostomum lignano TaxID=282301 RepID=A0A1I8FCB6_9PLAT